MNKLFGPKFMRILLFFTLFLAFQQLKAQDIILTMSGNEIPCRVVSDSTLEIRFEVAKNKGKYKAHSMHRSDVFSITRNGSESVLYAPDAILGDELSVQELRIYIAGEQDARKNYKAVPTMLVGVALAGTAAYVSEGAFLGTIAIPIVYPLAQLIPVIKIKEHTISNPNHRYNNIYASGYEGVARSKKIFSAFKGVLIGSVSGYLLYLVTTP